MADRPNDPKAPLRNLVLSCNADLIRLMARMGYPVRPHLQERVRNGLWHDDDCRRVGYKEELVKVGWKSGFMSRCEGCGQSLIFTKSFAFSCGHQFCKACSGKSIRRRYNPVTNVDRDPILSAMWTGFRSAVDNSHIYARKPRRPRGTMAGNRLLLPRTSDPFRRVQGLR